MSHDSTLRNRHGRNIGVRRHRRVNQHAVAHRTADLSSGRSVMWRFLEPGTVVWAQVPYREIDGAKVRPVVVINATPEGVTGYPCTTSPARFAGRVAVTELHDLRDAGLERATGVLHEPIRLHSEERMTVSGKLSANDLYSVMLASPSGPVAA